MKMQLTPKFPARVIGSGGITVTIANGVYTFSLSAGEPVVVIADATIAAGTSAVAVNRNNPVITNLQLPSVASQGPGALHIIDFSINVVNHQILLLPAGIETIMRAANWSIYSTAQQLGSLTLYPSTTLNAWYM